MTKTKIDPALLDNAKERWNRGASRYGREQAASAHVDPKNPTRIVLTNVNGEVGAYQITKTGELRLEKVGA